MPRRPEAQVRNPQPVPRVGLRPHLHRSCDHGRPHEAARRAVNCLLIAAGYTAQIAQIWPLTEPEFLEHLQEIERIPVRPGPTPSPGVNDIETPDTAPWEVRREARREGSVRNEFESGRRSRQRDPAISVASRRLRLPHRRRSLLVRSGLHCRPCPRRAFLDAGLGHAVQVARESAGMDAVVLPIPP